MRFSKYMLSTTIFHVCIYSFAQNVGINNDGSLPNQLLHIHDNLSSGLGVKLTNSTTGNGLSDGLLLSTNGLHVEFNQRENAAFRIFTNNLERLTVLGNGNVGIGTSPSEALSISGAIHLIPQTSPPSTANEGDIYADTDDFLYYFNGNAWEALNGGANSWSTTGNAGTNATNYIGTSDNRVLRLRTNGIDRLVIDNQMIQPQSAGSNTYYGIGAGDDHSGSNTRNSFIGYQSGYFAASASDNTALGYYALRVISSSTGNTAIGSRVMEVATGSNNTAVGNEALTDLTTGTNNTAVGKYSLYRINTEAENTAVGTNSLWNLTTGDDNVGIGDDALSSMTSGSANVALGENVGTGMSSGNNNVLVGRQSFMGRPSGSNNVGLGYEAGIGSDAISGSVFVGYRAGFFESSSNRLYIENSNTNGSNALIYGEFDNDSIRLNANTYVKNDLTVGNDVLFENLSGSGTRMAIINDNGNLSTQTLASGGDLSGNFPNLSVQGIRGNPISATTPSVDQVLKWDGTNWSPQADNTEDLSDTWHSVGSAGEPAFQNSWVNTFANIDYDLMFKKVGSVVWIRGAVQKSGASGTTTLFTLPAGYRPGKNTNVRQLSIVFSNPYEIVIYSNGNVDLQKGGGMHVYTFEISYRID